MPTTNTPDPRLTMLDALIRASRHRIQVGKTLTEPARSRFVARSRATLAAAIRRRAARVTALAARDARDRARWEQTAWDALTDPKL